MNTKEYRYTKDHCWICPEPDGKWKMGITAYAQYALGELLFIDLATPGSEIKQGQKLGEIEAVKTVLELLAPASGTVTEINQRAVAEPKLVNRDPLGDGWLVKAELSNPSELSALMNDDQYAEYVAPLIKDRQEQS